jgi:Flp pilus assembly protein TadD
MYRTIGFCILLTASVSLYAQKTPAAPVRPPSTGPTNPNTNPNPNPTNPNNTNPNNNNNNINTPTRPIFLSGKVVLQDGTPPPEPVKIERICGGSPRPQGYTDMKGRFQFQLDSQIGVEADASDMMSRPSAGMVGRPPSGLGARGDLVGCDLRAVLPGFISGSISLAGHTSFDNPDVGTIVLRRAGNVEGTTISMSSLNAPKDAQKAYEKGRELLKKDKAEEAERSFQKAVDLYPKYATAWFQLGLLQARGHVDQAEASFNHSVEADPKFVSPYLTLIVINERAKQWEKAVELSDTVIKLNATDFPQAYFYKAVAQYNLHDEAASEKSVRKAIELDVRHDSPQSEKLLGVILTGKNDLAGASEHLHKYLELAPNANDAPQVRAQLAEIDKQAVAAKQP